MRYIFLISILVFFGCLNSKEEKQKINNVEEISGNSFKIYNNYPEAVKQANISNKKILILFTKEYCGWCHKFKDITLKDNAVSQFLKDKYVVIYVDRDDKDKYPTRKFTVSSIPTYYIISKKQTRILDKTVGYMKADGFLKLLHNIEELEEIK